MSRIYDVEYSGVLFHDCISVLNAGIFLRGTHRRKQHHGDDDKRTRYKQHTFICKLERTTSSTSSKNYIALFLSSSRDEDQMISFGNIEPEALVRLQKQQQSIRTTAIFSCLCQLQLKSCGQPSALSVVLPQE